ncbi:hypothetical protein [Streptomyces sp. NPDC046859]|uniref:hypothetical protein n=1 Tax=Streptomyces sp. NPDC046859 TaxID=3155734 RepID=UPI0033E34BBD
MDHFERELARMMRDSREYIPFEPEHRTRLHAGVRTHRRVRAVKRAAGSVLAVVGIGIGFAYFALPHDRGDGRPQGPFPRPATAPASPGPTPSPELSAPSESPSESPTGSAGTSSPSTTAPTAGRESPTVDPTRTENRDADGTETEAGSDADTTTERPPDRDTSPPTNTPDGLPSPTEVSATVSEESF